MTEVISVRFRGGTKNYYFDPNGLTIAPDQYVVVQTAQGLEYACCVAGNHTVSDQSLVHPLRSVVRIATDADRRIVEYNRQREKRAFEICEKKIAAHKLEMKLVNVECSFEGTKIIFFFTAEGRVDFRELVKDLAGAFRARIELRQIGVRDEAKMLGGLGICGRPLCCSQFLEDFIPVSIKMAKTQNLSLNPTKISGTCGRLMCCLKYEQNAYEDAVKRMPKSDSFVDTPDGVGNVSGLDLLREEVSVRLDSAPDSPRKYKNCEVCVLRNGKGSRDGIEIPAQRPARCAQQEEERPEVSADLPWEGGEEEPGTTSRRRQRNGRGRSADRPSREERPARGDKPQQSSRNERSRSRSRGGEKLPRPAAETVERAEKAERVEKLSVRPTGNTTAAMKAAADRARLDSAPAGAGAEPKQERTGQTGKKPGADRAQQGGAKKPLHGKGGFQKGRPYHRRRGGKPKGGDGSGAAGE